MDALELPNKINELLAIVKTHIEFNNSIHYFDVDTAVEDVVCELINAVEECSLENLNKAKLNYKAIDLGDKGKKLSVQVTAEKNKIKETITAFIDDSLYSTYTTLIYFVTTGKQNNYTVTYDTQGHFTFNNDDHIWDFKTIVQKCKNKSVETQRAVLSYLVDQVKPKLKTDFEGDFYPDDIKSVIDAFSNKTAAVPEGAGLPYERKDIEVKNQLNNLSEAYFKYIQGNSAQYFAQIFDFLQNPINKDSLTKYESIASDLQKKILLKRSDYDKFDEVFNFLEQLVFQDGLNRKWTRIFLHYMYYQCDIGQNE